MYHYVYVCVGVCVVPGLGDYIYTYTYICVYVCGTWLGRGEEWGTSLHGLDHGLKLRYIYISTYLNLDMCMCVWYLAWAWRGVWH
jgi:hypothetical protein